jgi:tetratricopeptide (TPR) repeat protein
MEQVEKKKSSDSKLAAYLTYGILATVLLILVVLFLLGKEVFLTKKVPTSSEEQAYYTSLDLTKRFPKDPLTWENLGIAEVRLGRLKAAETHLKKALELDPKRTRSLYWLSQVYLETGRKSECVASLKSVIEIDPDHEFALYDLAEISYNEGQYDQAIKYLNALVKTRFYWTEPLYLLGRCYEATGDFKKAEESYQAVLKYFPDHEDSKKALKRLERKK